MSADIGASKTKSEPNVVPLCDILLVLLIIFMVITPTLQKGIDIKLPETVATEEGSPQISSTIMLVIEKYEQALGQEFDYKGFTLKLNTVPLSFAQLEERLRSEYQTRQEKVIFIRVDETTPYQTVLEIIDKIRGAGVETLGLIPDRWSSPGSAQPAIQ